MRLVGESGSSTGLSKQIARHAAKDPFLHAAVAVSSSTRPNQAGILQEKTPSA